MQTPLASNVCTEMLFTARVKTALPSHKQLKLICKYELIIDIPVGKAKRASNETTIAGALFLKIEHSIKNMPANEISPNTRIINCGINRAYIEDYHKKGADNNRHKLCRKNRLSAVTS